MTNAVAAPVWAELLGQPEAIAQLEIAIRGKADGVYHAWLITGPPGSGRSNMAHAFAAALLCEKDGCGECKSCLMAAASSHPDISTLATERVQISIDEVRELVASSQFGGSLGRYRIMIIEDADRMQERSSNVLLKALEEPPAGTIWLLCAPSEADMLPTIRSRVRRVGLKVPAVEEVARILIERDGIETKLAHQVAAEAQSHIGMARRLATSSEARSRRRETLIAALAIIGVTSAVNTAERWLDIAKKDAEALTNERDEQEKAALMRSLGLQPGDAIPTNLKSDLRALEEGQKRRATRSVRDGLDRILVDLLSLYRDVLTLQISAQVALVNEDLRTGINEIAGITTAAETIHKLDAIAEARIRIDSNVRDLMVLESLAVQLRRKAS
ncbi:DNA polymerase III subunit delta' [Rhodoluna lacicola]|uniref:DNA polymerase III, gamma/tau subunits n=1 Tax=Rhodoluna lacicola TaxID=529884 RepID=A0A060JEJ0_9MICO|nr:DNA polymerase III subunit delta' [Rhodoluna lacicola]AIC47150.1 DNA polymerase III, gamma/tau subunits [Rhodoluna lacicola]